MPLERGVRLGAYEIEEPLGAGGMGEVYRARDTRLGRSVAIKVLPPARAGRENAVARFEQEARAASALNHPHIVHVYDAGSEDGIRYIAMELIDGETLRAKIGRRTPFRELHEPLIDVAEALAKAHAAGIVHRDLKPENVMISRDGYAKVLDFGLAKLVEAPVDSNAATAQHTANGVVVGTFAYMAPEQLEGRPVDARTDVYAFGRILHELPGGDSELQRIAQKCLARDPAARYQSMKEVAAELREMRSGTRSRRWWMWIASAVIAALAGLLVWRDDKPAPQPKPPAPPFSRITMERLTFTGDVSRVAISPSGRLVAFVRTSPAGKTLWMRQVGTGEATPLLPATRIAITNVVFSPGEDYLYFLSSGALERLPVIGGPARTLAQDVGFGPTSSPDGKRIAYVRKNRLFVADADGSNEQVAFEGPQELYFPQWAPHDDVILCLAREEGRKPRLVTIDLRTRRFTPLRETPGEHIWMPGGAALIVPRILPEPEQQLRYIPFPSGPERRITNDTANYLGASVTRDGRTIASVQLLASRSLAIEAPGKPSRQVTPPVPGRSDGIAIAVTPDGAILYVANDREMTINEIPPRGGEARTIVSEPFRPNMGASRLGLSPDGKQIAYTSHRDGSIWVVGRDGGNRRRVTNASPAYDPQWLSDGSAILYRTSSGLWQVPAAGGEARLIDAKATNASLSPDGKRMLIERGAQAVITGAVETPIQLPEGHRHARWSPRGDAIEFVGKDDYLWRMPLRGGEAVSVEPAVTVNTDWAWLPSGELVATVDGMTSDAVLIRDAGP